MAAPLLLAALALAGHETWLQWTTRGPWANTAAAEPVPKKPPNYFDQFDAPAPKPGLFDDLSPKPYYHADYTGALGALALSLILYIAARAVGWIIAGFIGGTRTP